MGEPEVNNADIGAAVIELVEAIRNPGPRPLHHREVMARHRQEWPTLWAAIDKIVAGHDQVIAAVDQALEDG